MDPGSTKIAAPSVGSLFSRCQTVPTAILNFTMDGLLSSPADDLYHCLLPYWPNSTGLVLENINFFFDSLKDVKTHAARLKKLVETLDRSVWSIILDSLHLIITVAMELYGFSSVSRLIQTTVTEPFSCTLKHVQEFQR